MGSSLATTASFILLIWRYSVVFTHTVPVTLGEMMPRLLKLTIPLGLNDILKSGLNTVENMLVPQGVRKGGASVGTHSIRLISRQGFLPGSSFIRPLHLVF